MDRKIRIALPRTVSKTKDVLKVSAVSGEISLGHLEDVSKDYVVPD
jgi:hypothetical protein